MRRTPTLACAVLALAGTALAAPADASGSAPTARTLLLDALDAANSSGSVHFNEKSWEGSQVQRLTGSVSASTAVEALSGGDPLQVELVAGTIYVGGNAAALESALQLTAAQGAKYATKWIAVPSGDSHFQTLAQAVTMSSTLDAFTPSSSSVHLGEATKLDGTRVVPIEGMPTSLAKGTKGSLTLFVSAKAPHLPVGGTLVVANQTARLNEAVAFSAWGTPVKLSAPTGAVPLASVNGS